MGIKSFLKQGMAYGLDKQYEKKCASRKILYKDWVASMEEAESSSAGERAEAVFLSDAESFFSFCSFPVTQKSSLSATKKSIPKSCFSVN